VDLDDVRFETSLGNAPLAFFLAGEFTLRQFAELGARASRPR
jgi:hypothetical protein